MATEIKLEIIFRKVSDGFTAEVEGLVDLNQQPIISDPADNKEEASSNLLSAIADDVDDNMEVTFNIKGTARLVMYAENNHGAPLVVVLPEGSHRTLVLTDNGTTFTI
jgi:hypothetical protein